MCFLEFGARFLRLFWICWQTSSAPIKWRLRTESALPVLRVSAQMSETGLWILHSYRSWWWWALRWGERSPTLLAGGSPRHACAVARRSGGCITTCQSWLSHADMAWLICEKELPAWAGCSRPGGTVWWRSARRRLTSFGVGAWRIGKPRRKNAPSDSCRSRRPSSVGLCCTCRKHTGGLMVMLKQEEGGNITVAFIWNKPFWRVWMDNDSLLWFIESTSWRRNKMPDYRKKRS